MSHFYPSSPLPLNYAPSPPGDSRIGRLIAWIVILVSVAVLVWSNVRASSRLSVAVATGQPSLPVEIVGRYSVGAMSVLPSPKSNPSGPVMVAQVDNNAQTPIDKLAVVALVGELEGKQAAIARLDSISGALPAELLPLAKALRTVYENGPGDLSADKRAAIIDHLGWLGKLALSFGLRDNDPRRAAVVYGARKTFWILVTGLGVGGVAILAGVILLVILLVKLADGKLRRNYRAPDAGGGIFLEAFAIYIGGMTAGHLTAAFLPHALKNSLGVNVMFMLIPTGLAIFWPFIRGASPGFWRYGLGWHAGRGISREIGFGLVGYLVGLPIIFVSMLFTAMLIKLAHAHPTHPVERMLGVSPQLTLLVFILASVWAPLTEETMFRGAFFTALRSKHGWILSAVVSSFIFAAVHPQGWTVIPVLMSIAIVFAGIREWRGTIFSSAAAHCLHNTVLLLMATMMMS